MNDEPGYPPNELDRKQSTEDSRMSDMRDMTTKCAKTTGTGPVPVSSERRQRSRLRDLCDEVLASFRAAHSKELISEGELAESRALLATMTPALSR